jgi:hypothetical protein
MCPEMMFKGDMKMTRK